ncbi:MAG: hypothetical protein COA57_03285 [Flavobacteriales bacterium]|nr:MAG: hypothetical protein COA57_03285 [Flavobacteriales bacterium]
MNLNYKKHKMFTKYRTFLSCLFVFHFSFFIFHFTSYSQDTTFIYTYGGAGHDHGRDVKQTYDGGFIITGSTSSFGNGSSDVYLLKIDSIGNYQWSKAIGGTNIDWGMAVQQTADSGYIVAGYTNSFGAGGYDVYVLKTDSVGNLEWQQTYGGSDWDFAYSLEKTTDGGYIIAGETYSYGNGNNDVYLLKIDSIGDTVWTKTYGGFAEDFAKSVKPTYDGGYIITGGTGSMGAGETDVYLIKTDASGDTVWTRAYGDALDDWGNSVIETIDSNYAIAGTFTNVSGFYKQIYHSKIDKTGNSVIWENTYGADNAEGNSLIQFKNGNYAAAGYWNPGSGLDYYLLFTSSTGLFSNGPSFGGLKEDVARSIELCNDNGLILVGSTLSYGAGLNDIWVIKTDSVGLTSSDTVNVFTDNLPSEISSPLNINYAIKIFPNPFSDYAYLEVPKKISGQKVCISVHNSIGETVKQFCSNNVKIKIERNNLPNGLYICTISFGNSIITKKLIIQ